MPRPQDGVGYFDTYPELVRQALEADQTGTRVAVFNRARGGMPIATLYEEFVQDSAYSAKSGPEILILQCGIVDCAPRPVPPPVKTFIGRLPTPLRWLTAKVLHALRPLLLGAGLSWQNTDQRQFEAVLGRWLRDGARTADRIYVINIAPTTPASEGHSPGLESSIVQFNVAIARSVADVPAATLVDVHAAIVGEGERASPYVNPTDGHHITAQGHQLYADLIRAFERAQPA